MSMEKPIDFQGYDDEVLAFVDDPNLNEFNNLMQVQADPDIYDAAPMPKDWDMDFPVNQMGHLT